MNIERAVTLIKQCARRMDDLYGQPVFDEWAIVSLSKTEIDVLFYEGPSENDFIKTVTSQKNLFQELQRSELVFGDFTFAYDGFGPKVDGLLVLGPGIYLICNNTKRSITQITNNPLWRAAQVPFVELADAFRADPLLDRSKSKSPTTNQ